MGWTLDTTATVNSNSDPFTHETVFHLVCVLCIHNYNLWNLLMDKDDVIMIIAMTECMYNTNPYFKVLGIMYVLN